MKLKLSTNTVLIDSLRNRGNWVGFIINDYHPQPFYFLALGGLTVPPIPIKKKKPQISLLYLRLELGDGSASSFFLKKSLSSSPARTAFFNQTILSSSLLAVFLFTSKLVKVVVGLQLVRQGNSDT